MRRVTLRATLLAAAGFAAWWLRRWFPVRVAGDSMSPTLLPGDQLAARPRRAAEPFVGQIVVARAGDREVVKRVVPAPHVLARDQVWILGDNGGRSTDSRSTGPVRSDDVVGIVRARYWPPRRAGLL